ncbi:MAG: hypothetical protein KatS3mg057_1660 [Herpetosiphonaceae bacterium]|nr:MAG: hypothetical protein KatS3mg057_1660 [Herpetosiphonaceae bacterium]
MPKQRYTVTFELSSPAQVARLQQLAAELGLYPTRGVGARQRMGSASALIDAIATAAGEHVAEVAHALGPLVARVRREQQGERKL